MGQYNRLSMFKVFKKPFFGKKAFQPFFQKLFLLSLEGMNIGSGGGKMSDNGEAFAVGQILHGERNPIVFDVGAQGGDYTDKVLKVTDGRAEVYAFEPSKGEYEKLKSDFDGRAHIVNFALSDMEGRLKLMSPKDKNGLGSFHRSGSEFTEVEEVQVTTIERFCQSRGIRSIKLLKLDVEGHELACLKGAKEMLPSIENIQFELSIASRDARVYFKDIFEFLSDYRIYRILRDGLFEIGSPDKLSELLFTTNFMAVRKD